MMYHPGDKVTLPDGRRAVVLDGEQVKFAGGIVSAYALRFFNDCVVDGKTHAEYVPSLMMVNSMRQQ